MLAPALRKTTALATTVTTFNMAAYWFKTIWLPTYFVQIRGLSLGESAWLLFMDQIGSVVGYVAFGYASDHFGRRPSFTAFSILKARGLADGHARLGHRRRLFGDDLRLHAARRVRRGQLGLHRPAARTNYFRHRCARRRSGSSTTCRAACSSSHRSSSPSSPRGPISARASRWPRRLRVLAGLSVWALPETKGVRLARSEPQLREKEMAVR